MNLIKLPSIAIYCFRFTEGNSRFLAYSACGIPLQMLVSTVLYPTRNFEFADVRAVWTTNNPPNSVECMMEVRISYTASGITSIGSAKGQKRFLG